MPKRSAIPAQELTPPAAFSAEESLLLSSSPGNSPRSLRFAMWGGIALAPALCIWVFRSEILYHSADLASNALSLAAIGLLLCLLGLRVILPRLGRREILLMYIAVAGTVGISTMGMTQFLITTLVAPFWFQTPGNRWEEFWGAIPAWAAPRSPEVVRGFFLGRSSLYEPTIWRAWLVPALAWGGFIAALLVAQYCLAHLLYPRWSKQERLTFPIVQLPLTLTTAVGNRRRMLFFGAAVALAIQGMNALHHVMPSVPGMRVLPVEIGSTLPPPWNEIGTTWYTFYPCIIGLAMLVPTNILFSCVFFFFVTKLENLVGFTWGLRDGGDTSRGFPYGAEQAQGAILALALLILWSARHALRQSLHSATDRFAWIGLALSSAVLLLYGILLGLRPMMALLLFGLFLLFMLGLGWLRAAVGPVWNPGNDVGWWLRAVSGREMVISEGIGLAYLRWFSFGDFRAHALPTYTDMMRLAEAVEIPRRRLLTTLAIASVLSIAASLWVALDVYYRYGAATALTDPWRTYQGRQAFDILRSKMDGVAPRPGLTEMQGAVWGFLFVFLLHTANTRLLWWPWHPAGFVMAQSGSLEWFWCPMAIALLIKVALLRAGGLKLYQKALPFFIGLMLGDYGISSGLALLGWLLNKPLYKPFPI